MKLIAQIPGWSLYDRLAPGEGWISLKLVGSSKLTKRSWWFGFNGTRMSRNRDVALLEQHQPDIYAWVVRSLSGLAQRRQTEPAPPPQGGLSGVERSRHARSCSTTTPAGRLADAIGEIREDRAKGEADAKQTLSFS